MRKPKAHIDDRTRQAVFERDHHTCRYCGNKEGPFSPDHVYPESKGGETTVKNLVTACRRCNIKKASSVGMWPQPIGYFDEHEKIAKETSFETKQIGSQIMINLVASSIMLALALLVQGSQYWDVQKVVSAIWFAASVYCACRWVIDFLRI